LPSRLTRPAQIAYQIEEPYFSSSAVLCISQTYSATCMLTLFSMEGSMEQCYRILNVVAAAATFLLVASAHAAAQQPCLAYQQGTVGCPNYGAPAATAVPGPSIDGGVVTVPNQQSTTLFGGTVPPNGFIVRVFAYAYAMVSSSGTILGPTCFVNDHGAAGQGNGFYMVPDIATSIGPQGQGTWSYSATFASPPGYKPIGPISIYCVNPAGPMSVAARGW
jgi:hypothetical protein